jgi:hypothetical protein
MEMNSYRHDPAVLSEWNIERYTLDVRFDASRSWPNAMPGGKPRPPILHISSQVADWAILTYLFTHFTPLYAINKITGSKTASEGNLSRHFLTDNGNNSWIFETSTIVSFSRRLGSNTCWQTGYPDRLSRGFPQSSQEITRIWPWNRPWSLSST